MRVSTSTINALALSGMNKGYSDYASLLSKIASRKNFTTVAENVPDATKVLKLNGQLAQLDTYQNNIQAAINEMNMSYNALGDVTDEIREINDLVLQASNATTTPDSAKAIAAEIKERVATIQDKMNTKYLDNFIFSGSYTQVRTYDTDSNGLITYQGSSISASDRNLTIAPNTTFAYNVSAAEIFGTNGTVYQYDSSGNITSVTYGSDFFSQMRELDDLLNAGTLDFNAIRGKIAVLENTSDAVTSTQGKVSARVSKLQASHDINESTITNLTSNKSDIEDLDIIKAASELASANTAMQASYQIGLQILGGVSLLDYL